MNKNKEKYLQRPYGQRTPMGEMPTPSRLIFVAGWTGFLPVLLLPWSWQISRLAFRPSSAEQFPRSIRGAAGWGQQNIQGGPSLPNLLKVLD